MCCGVTKISQMSFHCGHCVSEANGGSLEVDNMRPICSGCNGSMGSKNMNDFIKKFKLDGKIIEPSANENKELLTNNNDCVNIKPLQILKYRDDDGKIKYKCKQCNKVFSHKTAYVRHCDRKTNCVSSDTYKCFKCDKLYLHRQSLYAHKKTCKIDNPLQTLTHDGAKWHMTVNPFNGVVYAKSHFFHTGIKKLVNTLITSQS